MCPSAFTAGAVPLFAFIVIVLSLSYGISCGKLGDLYQVYKSLYVGINVSLIMADLYFVMQLYFAVMFVFF